MKKETKLSCILCLLLILWGHSLWSQELQLAGFNFTRFPGAEVADAPLNQKIEVNEYNFFVNLPKQLKNEKTIVLNGLQYKLTTPFADNDLALGIDGQNLHLIGYRLTVLHQLKKDWSLIAMINPTLSSTFNVPLEGDDLLVNGTIQAVRKKSDRFHYGGGLLVTSRFGNPILLPTIQLKWKSEKSQFHVFLPRSITYDRYYKRFTAGIHAVVDGSLYNVNFELNAEPVDKVAYTRVTAGPKFSYRLGKILQLEASGGVVAGRSVELQSEVFEDRTNNVDSGAFFQFGISLVPPVKE
ncbi:MAG: DUF6268 family outer membrane beta-barrel protein [Bacteroidota bacterium]